MESQDVARAVGAWGEAVVAQGEDIAELARGDLWRKSEGTANLHKRCFEGKS